MARGSYGSRLRRSGAIGALLTALAGQALAQEATTGVIQTTPPAEETAETVERVVITGTRLQSSAYTSPSPMTVITADEADAQGITDIATLLQNSAAAAGSSQVTAAISSALAAPPGGLGTQTISLRGLGAQRTLVLLNGRRAGPAGTGGTVGPFDLNVIPLSAVERVDILKDGASSLYGSDAIAGVINIITKTDTGGSIDFSFTRPQESSAGQDLQVSATYGKDFDRGYFRITADYFEKTEFDRGDRDYFQCGQNYFFSQATGERADYLDPRTGNYRCSMDAVWGHNWVYNYQPDLDNTTRRPWRSILGWYQYDHFGNLGDYVPAFGPDSIPDPSGLITPPNWYPVNYNTTALINNPALDPVFGPSAYNSAAVWDYYHPFLDELTLSPNIERTSIFANGEYSFNDSVTAYGEVLLNRRTTHNDSYTQFYSFQELYTDGSGTIYGDPVAADAGWTFRNDGNVYDVVMSPTGLTDNADESVEVDYTRFVGGLRGDLGETAPGWTWDIAAQYSKSEGTYTEAILWVDAIDDYAFRTDYCANVDNGAGVGLTRYRGIPCVDINWYSPSVMFGNLTQQEQDFLTGSSTSRTEYEQMSVEGYVTGPLVDLPAGPLDVVLGFLYQEDSLSDQPSQEFLDGEVWGGAGPVTRLPTAGSDITRAIFAEMSVPLLADIPLIQNLDLSLSGRYTDVRSYGGDSTYKAGLNWQLNDAFRIRASNGTSFRTPGLYELYLARQYSGAFAQGNDPCAQWGDKLANAQITQRQADNCAIDPKAGGAIAPDQLLTAGIQARVYSNGGFGSLGAETSESNTIGVVWTPSFADLQISLDYFDIEVSGEVGRVSAGYIINECYDSPNFPTDPLCALFTRFQPGEGNPSQEYTLQDINLNYLNIASQTNSGIDLEARYRTEIPWGDLDVTLRASRQLESGRILQPGSPVEDENGQAGEPKWVAQLNTALSTGSWTFNWGLNYIDATSESEEYWDGRTTAPLFLGQPVVLDLTTPPMFYHNLAVGYDFENIGVSAMFGIRNVFDQEPPRVSSAAPDFLRVGNAVIESQYDPYGRTFFFNVSKRF